MWYMIQYVAYVQECMLAQQKQIFKLQPEPNIQTMQLPYRVEYYHIL